MKKVNPDRHDRIESIIEKAVGYMNMSNALHLDAAFERATREVFSNKHHGAWAEYKNEAKGTFLNREKKERERGIDYKHEELLRGAQEAAWARKDAYAEEAEKNEEELSELRSGHFDLKK